MVRSRRARSAFTLIELLVVIAIIAILIGMLVPAVQKVRAAAARSQCSNNLKQIGLAMHMYQDQHRALPPGWATSLNGTVAPSPGWSWSYILLPYIEQGALFSNISGNINMSNTSGGPGASPNPPTTLMQTPVPIYLCPADTNPIINSSQKFQDSANALTYGKTNYVVNRMVVGPGGFDGSTLQSAMSVQAIADGSSNTILVGERDMVVNVAAIAFARHSKSTASFEGRMGAGLNPQPSPGTVFTTDSDQRFAYNSQHTGGCNFLFADGSVHFISNSIDCDPNEAYTNFRSSTTNPLSGRDANVFTYTGQRLESPNDGLPVGNYE